MGDGKVALILDVIGISQRANFVAEGRERALSEIAAPTHEAGAERQTLLICRYGESERVAIPLGLVARLEAFPLSAVEKSSSIEVVQYRGEIMPLVRLSQILGGGGEDDDKESIQVVVYRDQGLTVGLVVEQIADIVEEPVKTRGEDRGGYYTGTAVVQGKVTDILNVRGVIESVDPSYLAQAAAA